MIISDRRITGLAAELIAELVTEVRPAGRRGRGPPVAGGPADGSSEGTGRIRRRGARTGSRPDLLAHSPSNFTDIVRLANRPSAGRGGRPAHPGTPATPGRRPEGRGRGRSRPRAGPGPNCPMPLPCWSAPRPRPPPRAKSSTWHGCAWTLPRPQPVPPARATIRPRGRPRRPNRPPSAPPGASETRKKARSSRVWASPSCDRAQPVARDREGQGAEALAGDGLGVPGSVDGAYRVGARGQENPPVMELCQDIARDKTLAWLKGCGRGDPVEGRRQEPRPGPRRSDRRGLPVLRVPRRRFAAPAPRSRRGVDPGPAAGRYVGQPDGRRPDDAHRRGRRPLHPPLHGGGLRPARLGVGATRGDPRPPPGHGDRLDRPSAHRLAVHPPPADRRRSPSCWPSTRHGTGGAGRLRARLPGRRPDPLTQAEGPALAFPAPRRLAGLGDPGVRSRCRRRAGGARPSSGRGDMGPGAPGRRRRPGGRQRRRRGVG